MLGEIEIEMNRLTDLWKYVIVQALHDYLHSSNYRLREAAHDFFYSEDFNYICSANSFNKEKILERFHLIKEGVTRL